jgi:putative copper export protein
MPGLGLMLDAKSPVKLSRLVVSTTTPGFVAEVLATSSQSGHAAVDSAQQTATSQTTFTLHGATARYYILWITRLPPGNTARVSEIKAYR